MKTFRFRLETLLKLRRAALDEQRAKLAEAYRAEALLVRRQQEIDQERAENQYHRRSTANTGVVQIDAALQTQRYEMILQAQRRVLEEQQRKLQDAIEQQRRVVVEADREVKVLEKLRERRLAEYQLAQQSRDIKHMDEIAARIHREERS
jgi:flagellar FliJ protein